MQVPVKSLAVAALLASPGAQAEVQFNGFLSVGAGVLDTDEAQYLDYSDEVDFKSDSVFALQVNAPVGEGVSVVGQVVARGTEDYDATVEWAFVSYELNEHWTLRGGRLRAPTYMYSDFLEVGYTYHWVRPPTEVYRIPFSAIEGVDALYRTQLGDWDAGLQAYYGSYEKDDLVALARTVSDVRLTDLVGVIGTLEKGSLLLRASAHRTEIDQQSASLDTLLAALRGLPGPLRAAGNAVADDLAIEGRSAAFYEVGMKYDPGDYFLVGEWTSLDFERSAAQDSTGWYVSGGLRFGGKSTLYLSYAKLDLELESGYSAPLRPFLPATAPLVAVVDGAITAAERDQESWTVGYRYDLTDSMDIKFEYQRFDTKTGPGIPNPGQFHDVEPGWDGEAGLFTVAVDVVF